MLISSFDKTIHPCKIVRIVLVDVSNFNDKTETLSNASDFDPLTVKNLNDLLYLGTLKATQRAVFSFQVVVSKTTRVDNTLGVSVTLL